MAAVDHLFNPLKLRIAGLYGLEPGFSRRDRSRPPTNRRIWRRSPTRSNWSWQAKPFMSNARGRCSAIHARAAPQLLARATELVEAALERLPKGYRVIAGNAGVETDAARSRQGCRDPALHAARSFHRQTSGVPRR
ncbi:hypothetical protein ACVOMV_21780 [Mesorhizobium atlanticum]